MDTLGIIIMVVGAILFYGSKIMYKKTEKKASLNNASDKEYLDLLNKATIIVRFIGAALVIAGAIFIALTR